MPRATGKQNHTGSIYLRGATYWGKVSVNGKVYRGSLDTHNRREAEQKIKEWVAGVMQKAGTAATSADTATDFGEAFDRFVRAKRTSMTVFTADSEARAKYIWTAFAKWAVERGLTRLSQVDRAIAQDYVSEATAGLSGSSLQKVRNTLGAVYAASIDGGNPFRAVTVSLRGKTIHANLTDAEVAALFQAAKDYDRKRGMKEGWYYLFLCAAATGLRLKDIVTLDRLRDFKDDSTITLAPSKTATAAKNKGATDFATVTIPVENAELLEYFRKAAEWGYTDSTALFPRIMRVYDTVDMCRNLRRIFARAGIDTTEVVTENGMPAKKSFHSFRIYAVSRLAKHGMPINVACKLFGWTNPKMYLHYFRTEEESTRAYFRSASNLPAAHGTATATTTDDDPFA